jgi:hypothetical protein
MRHFRILKKELSCMAELIVAVFNTVADADAAERDLREHANILPIAINRYHPDDPDLPDIARSAKNEAALSSPVTTHPKKGGFMAWLLGDDADHAQHEADRTVYDEHINAGRIIISVQAVDQQQADHVMRLLEEHAPTDIEAHPTTAAQSSESAAMGRATGITPEVASDARAGTASLGSRHGEEVIPVSEEQLNVGKRVIDRGTTFIRRYVVEKPVETQVNLRDETTTIERRTPITPSAPGVGAFEERTVEVRNTTEEPVISKTAGGG